MNLNNQFASNGNNTGNVLYYFDEEYESYLIF